MTPKQRVLESLTIGGKPDCTAAGPFTGYYAAGHAGIPLGKYVRNGRLIAEAQLRLQEDLCHDILITAADTYYIAEAFGLDIEMYPDALPTARRALFSDLAETRRLKVPDPGSAGRMPVYLEAVRHLKEMAGDDLAIRGTGTGPFSLAAYLFGIDNFMLKLMDIESGEAPESDAKDMRNLLELMTETTLRFVTAQAELGADILYVGDSLASLNMISPQMYRNWVHPYHQRIFSALKELLQPGRQFSMIHMCGNNMDILADMISTGVDLIEIDAAMNLTAVSGISHNRVALIGNIDPVKVLNNGSVTDVGKACNEAVRQGVGNGRFILGSGCFVCPGTPFENLQALVSSAHNWGG